MITSRHKSAINYKRKPHVRSLETVFVCNIGYKYTIKGKVIIFAIIPKD